MSSTYLVTYQDIVEHVLDMFDEERSGRPLRAARRAARDSLRELFMFHRWSYYESDRSFTTDAQQTTGTIAYDHTGGSAERLVTLSDATWPSNVSDFKITISDSDYPISSRLSDTTITLDANQNPGTDVSSTTYRIYREAYPLPVNFANFGNLIDLTNNRVVPLLTSDSQVAVKEIVYNTPDTPWHATIKNAGEYLNSQSIVFVPPPSSAIKYRYTYQRSARQLNTEKYSDGTVSVSSGSTSVSISTGAFSTSHIGCVIRFSTTTTEPTSLFGGLDGTDNPFIDQAVITSVASDGSSCVIDTAVSQAYSGVAFTVSDPVDIEVNTMLTAYQRLCEAQYSIINKRNSDIKRDRQADALMAVRIAIERDQRTTYSPTYADYDPFTRTIITDDDS